MEYTGVEHRIVEYSGLYTGVEQRIVEYSGIYWSRAEDSGKQWNILE